MSKFNKRHCCCNNSANNYDNESVDEEISPSSNICHTLETNCSCGFDMDSEAVFPVNPTLAQSYVPIQRMNKIFSPEVGLKMGTIFPELVSPYSPGQSIQEIEYLKATNPIGEGCNR